MYQLQFYEIKGKGIQYLFLYIRRAQLLGMDAIACNSILLRD